LADEELVEYATDAQWLEEQRMERMKIAMNKAYVAANGGKA